MGTTIVIIGKSLQLNKPFLEHINTQSALIMPQNTIFLDKNTKELFMVIEKIIKESHNILFITTKESFNLLGKIISTLSDDALELKDNMLIPSRVTTFTKNSYLVSFEDTNINVLEAQETLALPEILLSQEASSKSFSLIDIDDDSINILLQPLAQTYEITLYTTPLIQGWSSVMASSNRYGELEKFLSAAKSLFRDKFIPTEDTMRFIVDALATKQKTLSVAESCTGGQIAALITSVSGSSEVFNGSIVSYANDIKKAWLGVRAETLKQHGAVSEACVKEMLEGILQASSCDFAMATSGIAGPGGGSELKPVGTVFVGARAKDGNLLVERLLLQGDRAYIQKQSALHALKLLLIIGKDVFFK